MGCGISREVRQAAQQSTEIPQKNAAQVPQKQYASVSESSVQKEESSVAKIANKNSVTTLETPSIMNDATVRRETPISKPTAKVAPEEVIHPKIHNWKKYNKKVTALHESEVTTDTSEKLSLPQVDNTHASKSQVVKKPLKPIAFEIPLGDELKKPSHRRPPRIQGKVVLPKLGLPQQENPKFSSTSQKWKVDDYLDKVLNESTEGLTAPRQRTTGRNGFHNASAKRLDNTVQLRKRLLEKEAQAALNRAKEIEKLQRKLARQEEHAKLVLERKRALGALAAAAKAAEAEGHPNLEKRVGSGAGFRSKRRIDGVIIEQIDSGNSTANNSRSGSGKTIII